MPKLTEDIDKISPVLVKTIIDRLRKLAERYVDLRKEHDFDPRMQIAFLYTTRTGLMKAFGSQVLVKCIEENQLKFSEAPEWEDIEVMMEDDMEFVTLPKLEKRLEEFTTIELSDLIQSLLKEIHGDKPLYWRNEKRRPDFWATDVPFKKIWEDEDSDEEMRLKNLVKVVEAIYSYHGYEPKTWVQGSIQRDRMRTRQRKGTEEDQKSERKKKNKHTVYTQLLEQVYKQIQKYNFIGRDAAEENIIPKLTMTCIYTTRNGTLRAYGAAVILAIVNQKQAEFMEHKAWEDPELLNSHFTDCVFLPRLKKKVSEFTVPELTKLITILLKDTSGKGQVFWGNEGHKPSFWPPEIPFVNPKSKPPEYCNMLEWKFALNDILISIYEFYGYDPKIWTKEMEHSYSIPRKTDSSVSIKDKEMLSGKSELCHVSVLYKDETLTVGPCTDCCEGTINNHHCPLCPITRFQPATQAKVIIHLDTHLGTQVIYKDFKILRCHLNCTYSELQKGHFHCPFCNVTRSRKDNIFSHVTACHKEGVVNDGAKSNETDVTEGLVNEGAKSDETEDVADSQLISLPNQSNSVKKQSASVKRQITSPTKALSSRKKIKTEPEAAVDVTPTRISSRIMSRREAGKVAVWKDLMPRSYEMSSKTIEATDSTPSPNKSKSTPKTAAKKSTRITKGQTTDSAEPEQKLVMKASVEISTSELEKINAPVEEILDRLVSETGVTFMNQEGKILIQGDWESICGAKQLLEKMVTETEESENAKLKSGIELELETNDQEKQGEGSETEVVEVYIDDLDDETKKFVENEVVTVLLPQNYKQTLDKASKTDEDRKPKEAHGRCAFIREPYKVKQICEVCGFTTTEFGLQKHKLRNHPDHFFVCEICHRSFGVRYDMRLHRKKHFDDDGKLLPRDKTLYKSKNPGKVWLPTLQKLEQSTVIVSTGTSKNDVEDWLEQNQDRERSVEMDEGDGKDEREVNTTNENIEDVTGEDEGEEPIANTDNNEDENELDEDELKYEENEASFEDELDNLSKEFEVKPYPVHSITKSGTKRTNARLTIRKMERIGKASLQGTRTPLGRMKLGGSFLVKDPSKATEECRVCGFKSSIKGLMKHRQRHHPDFRYQCHFCEKQFGVRNDLVRHMEKHTKEDWLSSVNGEEDNGKTVCSRCGFTSDAEEEVKKHVHDELAVKGCVVLHCERCSFEGSEKDMSDHMKVKHAGKMCAMCREVFKTSDELSEHVLKNHLHGEGEINFPTKSGLARDTARFTCEVCHKSLSVARFQTHMKTHERKYKCTECDFEADGRYKLKSHITLKHEWPKDCEICGVSLSYPVAMKLHMQSKHGDQNFPCSICEKVFTERRYLTVHIQRVHNKRKSYTCDVCGRGFFEKYRWKLHKEIHLAEVSEEAADALRKIACSFCGKRFRTRAHVIQHENAHQGIRKYVCKICNRAFTWSAELNKHKMSHLKIKPYPCELCNKAFSFKGALEAHMTMHTKQGKHRCQQCGKVYTASASLRRHRCKAGQGRKRQEFYVQIQNPAEIPQDTVYEIQLESTEALPAGVGEMQLVEQGSMSQEEEEGVAYMCGICRQLFNNASTVNEHIQLEHAGATTVVEEGEVNEMPSEQDSMEELVFVEADENGKVVEIQPGGISLEGQQIIEMTPEEAAQLLGENLVSNIVSTTETAENDNNDQEQTTEMVYVTTESVANDGISEEAQEIHVQEVAGQPTIHFLPTLTSEEQAVANTLADLAQ